MDVEYGSAQPPSQTAALVSVLFISMNIARQDQPFPLNILSKELVGNLLA